MPHDYKKKRLFNQGWHSIDKVAKGVFRPLIKKKGLPVYSISLDWHLIVGEFLAAQTYPNRLYFDKGKKVKGSLKLLVKTSFIHEFSFHKQQIIERINAYFGYNVIEHLSIHQVYALPARKRRENPYGNKTTSEQVKESKKFEAIYQDLSDIKNDKLRESLAELGFFLKE